MDGVSKKTETAPTKRAATRIVKAITFGYLVVRMVESVTNLVNLFI
mgnify:CR=1 FL=1